MSSRHIESIQAELKKQKDLGMPIKQDLYEHLTEVFNRIMLHHPTDAFDRFETISSLVKRNNIKISEPLSDIEINSKRAVITN